MTREHVADQVGISQSTLREWEKVGLLPTWPARGRTLARYVALAYVIAAARGSGVSPRIVREAIVQEELPV